MCIKRLLSLITKYVILLLITIFMYNIWYHNTRGVIMVRINLSTILGAKRITQAELARKTGIRPATINEMYHELSERINLDHLDRICEYLNCDIADLLEYKPNKERVTGKNLIVESHGNRKEHN